MKPSICPNCGGEVPRKAKACPHCGSDENTGWSENTYLDGIDLYDEEDYQNTLRKEFGTGTAPWGWKRVLFILAVFLVLAVFIALYVLRL